MAIFESEGEDVNYAPEATPVEASNVEAMNEAVNDVMADSLTTTNYGSMAELNSEGLEPMNIDSFVKVHSAEYRDVSSMGLADYEEWLFKSEDEAGQLALARVVANFKASGYEVKPHYAAIAATTWSRANFAGEEHTEALKNVERAKVSDLQPYVIEIEAEGLDSLIDIVRKAEANATDYKAEMIQELRAEFEAENKGIIDNYGKPLAIAAATVLGMGLLWRMK